MASPSSVVVLNVDYRDFDCAERVPGRRVDQETPVAAELSRPGSRPFAIELVPCPARIVLRQVSDCLRGSECIGKRCDNGASRMSVGFDSVVSSARRRLTSSLSYGSGGIRSE